jgi:hypothetical protein
MTGLPSDADALIEAWCVAFPSANEHRCEHCDSRGADFTYHGHRFCCECMSELCSWLLDGGMAEHPDQFAYLLGKP